MRVVIFSFADDIHALAVDWALKLRGIESRVICQADFPQRTTLSAYFGAQHGVKIHEPESPVEITSADVVWNRRIGPLVAPPAAHPSDLHAIEKQGKLFLQWFRASIFADAIWINSVESQERGSNKLQQLRMAEAAGFNVAPTLVSNAPVDIRAFLASDGAFIAKPLAPLNWHSDEISASAYTAEISGCESYPDDALQWLPMIYQRKLEKDFELRIVVMGRSVFAVRINSQDVKSAALDWRAGQDDPNMVHEAFELPTDMRSAIFRFMDAMGLLFGSLDVVVAPDGQYWFLEINEQGQFLFLETILPSLPLLDAFSQFCSRPSGDFVYAAPEDPIRLSSFYQSDYFKRDHCERLSLHLFHTPHVSEKE